MQSIIQTLRWLPCAKEGLMEKVDLKEESEKICLGRRVREVGGSQGERMESLDRSGSRIEMGMAVGDGGIVVR